MSEKRLACLTIESTYCALCLLIDNRLFLFDYSAGGRILHIYAGTQAVLPEKCHLSFNFGNSSESAKNENLHYEPTPSNTELVMQCVSVYIWIKGWISPDMYVSRQHIHYSDSPGDSSASSSTVHILETWRESHQLHRKHSTTLV